MIKFFLTILGSAIGKTAQNSAPAVSRQIQEILPKPTQRRITRKQAIALAQRVNEKYFAGRMSDYVDDAAAIIFVESSGDYDENATADKNAVRVEPDGRTSYGLMQVLLPTAKDLYRKGYNRFKASPDVLMTHEGGVYFGMAYMDFLKRNFPKFIKTHQDLIRAYNGGQGWKLSNRGISLTAQYYNKYTKQYEVNSEVA